MLNSLHYLNYRLGRASALTQTTEAERAGLRRHAQGRKRLAEIGVFHGVNTRAFREAMAADGVLLAVDPFPRRFFGIRGYGFTPLRLPVDMDFSAMFHGVDERVPVSSLEFGSRVLDRLLRTY